LHEKPTVKDIAIRHFSTVKHSAEFMGKHFGSDCKDLSKDEFIEMTNEVIPFLGRSGLRMEVKDKENPKLTAFRRNIHFPELLLVDLPFA
jgi:hypothetical protein